MWSPCFGGNVFELSVVFRLNPPSFGLRTVLALGGSALRLRFRWAMEGLAQVPTGACMVAANYHTLPGCTTGLKDLGEAQDRDHVVLFWEHNLTRLMHFINP